jgi:intracellular sulfur oxidation DsrE/DsrF family protein
MKRLLVLITATLALCVGAAPIVHAESMGKQHRVVFQVDSSNKATQNLVLNNAVNLQKEYGPDNVTIEVVAYGPGLSMLTKKSAVATRVESLNKQDIRFSACANTMKGIERKTGKKPVLLPGMVVVPAGVARIVELQEKGYSYIKP